jgi:Uma2 family endonuclease
MATQSTHNPFTDSTLPLYRLDAGTYGRLVDAGALEGVEVELLDGLLVNKWPHREDCIHRLDVGTFERMVASGELEGRPIELLEGLLVKVSPEGPEHALVISSLTAFLASARGRLDVQLPLETQWGSLPEPDLMLTDGKRSPHRHPRTALLVIEVAVSSLDRDRETKAGMYASAPVLIYWLVDGPARTIEVRTEPGPQGYGRCEIYGLGTKVPSPAEGVGDLDVTELFSY